MSMQDQIDAVCDMAQSHSVPIIAQGAAIRFLCNVLRDVIGDDFDSQAANIISMYEEALEDGSLKGETIEQLKGLLLNE